MATLVVIRKNGKTVQRRDIHGLGVPKSFSVGEFVCVCRQTFHSETELTQHLRWAERRPHEKHRRV